MKHLHRIIFLFTILCFAAFCLCGCEAHKKPSAFTGEDYLRKSELIDFDASSLTRMPVNSCTALNVPTYITKVLDTYFIVDCYHNQVIFHHNLTDPLTQWQVMTRDISMGHSLASDGMVYLIDDTENNRILVMERQESSTGEPLFIPTQEFTHIGSRPHYILYHEPTDTFYAWSSQSGEMFLFRHRENDPRMYLTEVRSIPSLNGVYVRSFTIVKDRIYFVSGRSAIIEADLDTFEIKKEYPVPDEICGMIQLTPIDDYYYITVSTDSTGNQDYATILRVRRLEDLAQGQYEDVYAYFIGGGTPYCITAIDGKWYLTEHRLPGHSIWSFQVQNNEIVHVTAVY